MRFSTLAALLFSCAVGVAQEPAPEGQDWPQWRGGRRDGIWRETGILEKFDSEKIPLRWSIPIGGGYTGPTVAKGRVYVMDRRKEPSTERILCVDWKSGKELWAVTYDCEYKDFSYTAGPRASVTVDQGRAYALGSMGHLHCLDAESGRIIWKRDLHREYRIRVPRWGVSASPLIEGDLMITQIGGAGDACVIALDARTGEERWKSLPDMAAYVAPIAVDQGSQRVVVLGLEHRLVGLNPANGEVFWSYDMPGSSWPISIPTPVVQDDLMFFTTAHVGSVLLRLASDRPAIEVVWRRHGRKPKSVDTLNSVIPTPLVMNGHVFGVQGRGELRCLELMSGKRQWENTEVMPRASHATMHLVRYGESGDRVWIFNELGELILARLTGEGYEEITRAKLIEPTREQARRGVAWSHPAYAYRHVFARSDRKLVCADLSRK